MKTLVLIDLFHEQIALEKYGEIWSRAKAQKSNWSVDQRTFLNMQENIANILRRAFNYNIDFS